MATLGNVVEAVRVRLNDQKVTVTDANGTTRERTTRNTDKEIVQFVQQAMFSLLRKQTNAFFGHANPSTTIASFTNAENFQTPTDELIDVLTAAGEGIILPLSDDMWISQVITSSVFKSETTDAPGTRPAVAADQQAEEQG